MHRRVISINMHADLQEVQTVTIYICFSNSDHFQMQTSITGMELHSIQKYFFDSKHELNVVVTR